MESCRLRCLGLCSVVLLLAEATLACELPGMTSGPSQPTISITAPTNGAEFQVGQEVNVLSLTSDARGVSRVELYVDGVLYRTDPSPDTRGSAQVIIYQTWIAEPPGTRTLSVVAVNVDGQESPPWAVTVRVVGESVSPSPFPTTEGSPPPAVTETPPPAGTPTLSAPTATLPPPTATLDPNAPLIKYFQANGQDESYTANPGESVTLKWEWSGVVLEGRLDPGNKPLACLTMPCTFIVVPEGTTTYTLRAINAHATTKASVTVEIR